MNNDDNKEILKVPYPIPFYTQQVDFTEANSQGFKSKQEAEHWQERGCGIASVKMIIDGFQKYRGLEASESYGELVYRGVATGAYCDRGWIHKGLVDLAKGYKVSGKTFRQSSAKDVLLEIRKDRPCIVSVTVGFKGGEINENGGVIPKGGHLIVVLGAVTENGQLKGFVVNHPSSFWEYNWENRFIDVEDFARSFSGAFMSFWIKPQRS